MVRSKTFNDKFINICKAWLFDENANLFDEFSFQTFFRRNSFNARNTRETLIVHAQNAPVPWRRIKSLKNKGEKIFQRTAKSNQKLPRS